MGLLDQLAEQESDFKMRENIIERRIEVRNTWMKEKLEPLADAAVARD